MDISNCSSIFYRYDDLKNLDDSRLYLGGKDIVLENGKYTFIKVDYIEFEINDEEVTLYLIKDEFGAAILNYKSTETILLYFV